MGGNMENLQRKNHNLKVKARADLRKQSKGYRNVYKNTEVEAFKLFRESKSALEKLEAKEEAVVEIFDALCAMTFYRGDLEDERNGIEFPQVPIIAAVPVGNGVVTQDVVNQEAVQITALEAANILEGQPDQLFALYEVVVRYAREMNILKNKEKVIAYAHLIGFDDFSPRDKANVVSNAIFQSGKVWNIASLGTFRETIEVSRNEYERAKITHENALKELTGFDDRNKDILVQDGRDVAVKVLTDREKMDLDNAGFQKEFMMRSHILNENQEVLNRAHEELVASMPANVLEKQGDLFGLHRFALAATNPNAPVQQLLHGALENMPRVTRNAEEVTYFGNQEEDVPQELYYPGPTFLYRGVQMDVGHRAITITMNDGYSRRRCDYEVVDILLISTYPITFNIIIRKHSYSRVMVFFSLLVMIKHC